MSHKTLLMQSAPFVSLTLVYSYFRMVHTRKVTLCIYMHQGAVLLCYLAKEVDLEEQSIKSAPK